MCFDRLGDMVNRKKGVRLPRSMRCWELPTCICHGLRRRSELLPQQPRKPRLLAKPHWWKPLGAAFSKQQGNM